MQVGHGLRPEIERVLLAEFHALVCAAPLPLLDEFRHYTEEALAARMELRIDALWEARQSRRARRVSRDAHLNGRGG